MLINYCYYTCHSQFLYACIVYSMWHSHTLRLGCLVPIAYIVNEYSFSILYFIFVIVSRVLSAYATYVINSSAEWKAIMGKIGKNPPGYWTIYFDTNFASHRYIRGGGSSSIVSFSGSKWNGGSGECTHHVVRVCAAQTAQFETHPVLAERRGFRTVYVIDGARVYSIEIYLYRNNTASRKVEPDAITANTANLRYCQQLPMNWIFIYFTIGLRLK